MEDKFDKFKIFISENKLYIFITMTVFFIFYGSLLNSINIGIDTQYVLRNPGSVLNWKGIGRQGLIFTKLILGNSHFNPYFSTNIGLALLLISLILWQFLLYKIGEIKGIALTFFAVIFVIHPIWVEQLYFTIQLMEFSFAMCLIPLVLLIEFSAKSKNHWLFLLSILMQIWIFSSYQSLVILYISGAVFCFIIFYKKTSLSNECSIHFYLKLISKVIISFIIAGGINYIITKLFFNSIEYLDNQIRWGDVSVSNCIKNIISHIKNVAMGNGVFYSYSYIISLILIIISVIKGIFLNKNLQNKYILILAVMVLQIMPFALTLYLGTEPTRRAQTVLPFVISCNFVLFISYWSFNKRVFAAIVGIIITFTQGHTVERLLYTNDVRFLGDLNLAQSISNMIKIDLRSTEIKKPVAFIGNVEPYLNPSAIRGEIVGISLFSWKESREPHYLYSSDYKAMFMRSVGIDLYSVDSKDEIERARKIALNMPIFPSEGAIVETDDFIVVKLSEDKWPEEIMNTNPNLVNLEEITFGDDNFKYFVDLIDISEDILTIKGWAFMEDTPSKDILITVYLYNEDNKDLYKIPSAKMDRWDVAIHFNNYNYYCGYVGMADVSKLDIDKNNYRVLLSYKYKIDEKETFIDTGKYLHE